MKPFSSFIFCSLFYFKIGDLFDYIAVADDTKGESEQNDTTKANYSELLCLNCFPNLNKIRCLSPFNLCSILSSVLCSTVTRQTSINIIYSTVFCFLRKITLAAAYLILLYFNCNLEGFFWILFYFIFYKETVPIFNNC